jgi:hypothetical protein
MSPHATGVVVSVPTDGDVIVKVAVVDVWLDGVVNWAADDGALMNTPSQYPAWA